MAAHTRSAPDRHRGHCCLPRALPPGGRSLRRLEDDVLASGVDAAGLPGTHWSQPLLHDAALEVPPRGRGLPRGQAQALLDDRRRPWSQQPPAGTRRRPAADRVAARAPGSGVRERGHPLRRAAPGRCRPLGLDCPRRAHDRRGRSRSPDRDRARGRCGLRRFPRPLRGPEPGAGRALRLPPHELPTGPLAHPRGPCSRVLRRRARRLHGPAPGVPHLHHIGGDVARRRGHVLRRRPRVPHRDRGRRLLPPRRNRQPRAGRAGDGGWDRDVRLPDADRGEGHRRADGQGDRLRPHDACAHGHPGDPPRRRSRAACLPAPLPSPFRRRGAEGA